MITIYMQSYEDCLPREKYKIEHSLGRSLLSMGLKELFAIHIPPHLLENALIKNPYGKPALKDYPGIYFNISHCSGLAACAFANEDIGMDLEQIHAFSPSILKKVLTQGEQKFLDQFKDVPSLYEECFIRFWTLKESVIKQSGMGLSMPLTEFSFTLSLGTCPPGIRCSREGLYFYQEKLEPDYILSVCSPVPVPKIQVIRQHYDPNHPKDPFISSHTR
ncbi:MAG TPA: 4'-phosphopantetheinyl transferase superfamily protein [Candidatus Scybalocola faecavium]|nr:4'-phosphopantetheinyl transferase superfamily protein [Candidatus Scybalocola faecavium]